jgi:hypothetical protein
VLATFTVGPEQFKVWITNPAAIERVLALRAGGGGGSIPNGRIHRGSGRAGHNAPFSWHLDADDIQVVDVAIELCDGRPSDVEQHVAEYVDTINRCCPWGATVTAVAVWGLGLGLRTGLMLPDVANTSYRPAHYN